MARRLPVCGFGGPLCDGDSGLDGVHWAASAFFASASAFGLGSGEIVPPSVVLGAGDLGVEEAIDGLVADAGLCLLAGEAAGDLLGRPTLLEAVEDGLAQDGVSFELGAFPAARFGLLAGVSGAVSDLASGVAVDLASDRRWRAIQICSDLPDRAALLLKAGNAAALFD
jgi:hypothetical protein